MIISHNEIYRGIVNINLKRENAKLIMFENLLFIVSSIDATEIQVRIYITFKYV